MEVDYHLMWQNNNKIIELDMNHLLTSLADLLIDPLENLRFIWGMYDVYALD